LKPRAARAADSIEDERTLVVEPGIVVASAELRDLTEQDQHVDEVGLALERGLEARSRAHLVLRREQQPPALVERPRVGRVALVRELDRAQRLVRVPGDLGEPRPRAPCNAGAERVGLGRAIEVVQRARHSWRSIATSPRASRSSKSAPGMP
jgi:hypothetical protein